MSENINIQNKIKELYSSQRFGVFSSIWKNQSHQTLVCFVVTDDLSTIIFGTPKNSRKFVNSRVFDKISLFVDSATNDPKDISQAMTISAVGQAFNGDRLPEEKYQSYLQIYLQKHPYLEKFITSPSTDLVIIQVEHYQVVYNFQTVIDWYPNPKERHVFYRQIMGEKISDGFFRGKIVKLANKADLDIIEENNAILIQNEELVPEIIKRKFKAIISENPTVSQTLKEYCIKEKIPYIVKLEDINDSIENGDDVSIDGYLGFIIMHKIR